MTPFVIYPDMTIPYIGPLMDEKDTKDPELIAAIRVEHQKAALPCIGCQQPIGYDEDFYQCVHPDNYQRLVGFMHERCRKDATNEVCSESIPAED